VADSRPLTLTSLDPRLLWSLLVCLALAGCDETPPATPTPAEAPPVAVRAMPVQVRPMAARYLTSTRLRAKQRAAVTARTRGVIERFLVEEGQQVAAGVVIVELEQVDQRIELEGASSELRDREGAWKRNETLFKRGALTEDALRESRLAYHAAKQRAARAELALARTKIKAPFAGQVLLRHADPGARVDDGTPLLDLADVYPLEADVSVPERHIAALQIGQPAFLRGEGELFAAEIARISPAVDTTSGTVKVTLRAQHGVRERPGAFVQVAIVTSLRSQARVVPRSALVGEGTGWHLFRLHPESEPAADAAGRGRVERLEVQLGYEDGPWVEVRGALEPDDLVVTQGAAALAHEGRVVWQPGTPPASDEALTALLRAGIAPVASSGPSRK
jgi:membrane fusion protein, multidrug efflux system